MNKNGEKKIVEIKENPAKSATETPETNGQQNNAGETTEKVSFWKHPIKWTKAKFEEHPVATTAGAVTVVGLLGVGVKCLADALGGEKTEKTDEVLDDVLDEDEDDEEEEI